MSAEVGKEAAEKMLNLIDIFAVVLERDFSAMNVFDERDIGENISYNAVHIRLKCPVAFLI